MRSKQRNIRNGARGVAAQVLLRIERDEAYSHVALDAALRQSTLDERDRALATRIVYGTLTWLRRLDGELERAIRGSLKRKTDPWVRAVLRSALFQLRYLDRTPSHAVVNDSVALVKSRVGARPAGFVNAVLRRLSRETLDLPMAHDPAVRLGQTYSLPDNIARRALRRWGAEAAVWAEAVNQAPPLCLRVNQTRVERATLADALDASLGRWAPDSLRVGALNAPVYNALQTGQCAVQDEASQLVVEMAWPLPMDGRVWDVCAGQGGKTVQLADGLVRIGSAANLWASDLHASKLERLVTALATSVPEMTLQTWVGDARQPPEAVQACPLVLLDAPCSGLGLIRRHPETRWRRASGDVIETLAGLQAELLDAVAPKVAPGGVLVYAVCTDTDEETTQQLERFLATHPSFRLERPETTRVDWSSVLSDDQTLRLATHRHDTDGFFAARLRRVA